MLEAWELGLLQTLASELMFKLCVLYHIVEMLCVHVCVHACVCDSKCSIRGFTLRTALLEYYTDVVLSGQVS